MILARSRALQSKCGSVPNTNANVRWGALHAQVWPITSIFVFFFLLRCRDNQKWEKKFKSSSKLGRPPALRVFLRANPRRNDASNLIAPVNRAWENVHLSAFWRWSNFGFSRKVQKTAKIALFGHFCWPILIFKAPYSLPKHPRWPYLLEKCGRSSKRMQNFGFKNFIFFPKMMWGLFLGKISGFLNQNFATFKNSYHIFQVNRVLWDAWGG